MHDLNTPFSTTWFLAPYCAWLGYGKFYYSFFGIRPQANLHINSHLPQRRFCLLQPVSDVQSDEQLYAAYMFGIVTAGIKPSVSY